MYNVILNVVDCPHICILNIGPSLICHPYVCKYIVHIVYLIPLMLPYLYMYISRVIKIIYDQDRLTSIKIDQGELTLRGVD